MNENKKSEVEELKKNIASYNDNDNDLENLDSKKIREQAIKDYLDSVGDVSKEINDGFEEIEVKVKRG